MKISSSDHIHGKEPLLNRTETKAVEQQAAKGGDKDVQNRSTGDKIEISGLGQEVYRVSEAVKMAPDIRTSKVEEIQRAVDNGTYQVDSGKIAEKMLNEAKAEFLGL